MHIRECMHERTNCVRSNRYPAFHSSSAPCVCQKNDLRCFACVAATHAIYVQQSRILFHTVSKFATWYEYILFVY